MDYEKVNLYNHDILESIEKSLPPDCELLIRTNHDPDGTSGNPKSDGKWFVHLIACKGYRDKCNVEHESVYKKYGNNLFDMICEAGLCAYERLSKLYPSEIGEVDCKHLINNQCEYGIKTWCANCKKQVHWGKYEPK